MEDRDSPLTRKSSAIAVVLFFVALVFIPTKPVIAQPGEQRTQEQIRIDLNRTLAGANENLAMFPDEAASYLSRASAYRELFFKIRSAEERSGYAALALADLDTALTLSPENPTALAERAQLRTFVDFLPGFYAIVADYENAIRLTEKFAADNSGGRMPEMLANYYDALSGVYLNRAEMLTRKAKPNAPQPDENSRWHDFDQATLYAQKAVAKPFDLTRVINTRLAKGDAAYKAREYALALDAYQSDEQYLGAEYQLLCENEISKEWCATNQRQLILMFSIRRARVYIRLHQPEKALAELNVYFAKAYNLECGQVFYLRSFAYGQMGNEERALADDETARKLGSASCPFDIPR